MQRQANNSILHKRRSTRRKKICAALDAALTDLDHINTEVIPSEDNGSISVILGQIGLILRRVQRGIPPGRASFLNLLHAARQAKPEETRVAP